VDEKVLPIVQQHISALTKLSAEFINHKRNTESLPKILNVETDKRLTIKMERKSAQNDLSHSIVNQQEDMKQIKIAKELNGKKNLVAEVA